MSESTCGQPVTSGRLGGTRYVGRCGCPVVADGVCQQHYDEQEYQRRQFQDMMKRATRHSRGIRFHNRFDQCSGCGAKVKMDEEHPWNVPHGEEAAWWEAHPDAPHRERARS